MKRITISLPDEMANILADEARRCRRSVSEVAREALIERLGLDQTKPRELPFAAVGSSGAGDLSLRVDEILAEEWTRERLMGER
jgi:Arc/MetJ-type ribon-helix-helix transcriptional regulator